MERFAGTDVLIDVIDAHRVDGDLESMTEEVEAMMVEGTPEIAPERDVWDGENGSELDGEHDGEQSQAQDGPDMADTQDQDDPAPDADNAAADPASRFTLIGCAFQDLPHRPVVDESYFTLIEDDDDDGRMKIIADIRYLDSRRDVGRGKAISAAEWKLWTQLYATD